VTDAQLASRLGDDLIAASQDADVNAVRRDPELDASAFYRALAVALVRRLDAPRRAFIEAKADATRIPGFREVNAELRDRIQKVFEMITDTNTGLVTSVRLHDEKP